MKKSSIAILIALSIVFSLSAKSTLATINEESKAGIELYTENAEKSAESNITKPGYLIRVKDQDVKLSGEGEDIYLRANSDLFFAESDPFTLFLINGSMNVISRSESLVSVYTPTTRVDLNAPGEYAFTTTEDEELFYNLSDSVVIALDGITLDEYAIDPMSKLDYIEGAIYALEKDQIKQITVNEALLEALKTPPKAPEIRVEAVLKNTEPEKPNLSIKSANLENIIDEIKVASVPSLRVVKSELVAKVPESPKFSITSISTLKDIKPKKSAVSVSSELVTLPVIISGRFTKPASLFQPKAEPVEIKAEEPLKETITKIAPIVIPPEAIEAKEEAKPIEREEITGSVKKNFVFDVLFSTRAFTDSETNEQSLNFSFQPLFKYGSMALTLNLDPIHILSYQDNKTTMDWVRYSIAFLESFRFRTLNEHFDITIDKSTDVEGDSVGLYRGVNHIWDGKTERLGLQMNLSYPRFKLRIYGNDLLLNTDRAFVFGVDTDTRLSQDTPVGFTLGLLAATDLNNFTESMNLYPQFSFYLPFYTNGKNYVGMKAGISLAFNPNTISEYEIDKSGCLISGTLPIKVGAFSAEPGIHYTNGPLHYNSVDSSNYKPDSTITDTSILTVASKFGYSGDVFGAKANIFFDVALKDMTIIEQNSFLDASIYLKFNQLRISAGANIQNYTTLASYKNANAKIYGGLDFTFPSVTTYLKAGITDFENKHFFLTYGATASFLSSDKSAKESKERDKKSLVHFDLITGYNYRFAEDKAAYLMKPILTIGNDDYFIALRAPLQLSFKDNKEFSIEGQNGNKWWDFGASETSATRKAFRTITDSVSIIDGLKLGGSNNVAYLMLERGWRKNGTLFTSFGKTEALSLRTGFNFTNLALSAFVDNLESPHIGELSIAVLPLGINKLSIGINMPLEILFKDLKNFDMNYYPEFRLDIPVYKKMVTLSALAIGHVGVEYKDGVPSQSSVIYDFENKNFSSALVGGELKLDFDKVALTVQGGYRIGNLTPDMYNRFTSIYNEIPTATNATNSLGLSGSSSADGFYGKISSTFTFKRLYLDLAYTTSNIEELRTNYKNVEDDLFSLKLAYAFNDALTLYGTLDRRGFIKLFDSSTVIEEVIKDKNTLFSLGFDWSYGILNLSAEYATALMSSGYSTANPYVNTNAVYSGNTTQSLSVTTRIHF